MSGRTTTRIWVESPPASFGRVGPEFLIVPPTTATIETRVDVEINNTQTLLEPIDAGLGIAIIPQELARLRSRDQRAALEHRDSLPSEVLASTRSVAGWSGS